jgi:hypothetical protein
VQVQNYPWQVFVAIPIVYLIISLMMGGKKVYFDPYTEVPEDPEGSKPGAATTPGAEPWRVGDKPAEAKPAETAIETTPAETKEST